MSYRKYVELSDDDLAAVDRVLSEIGGRVSFPREVVRPLFDLIKRHRLGIGRGGIECNSCVKDVVNRFTHWQKMKIEADETND